MDSGALGRILETFALKATEWTERSTAFVLAVIVVIAWAATGPFYGYSDTWQLIINTGTTIVTFLMVFLIQRSQNKDSKATQLKLNEIVAAIHGADNRLIAVERLPEEQIEAVHQHYERVADDVQGETPPSSERRRRPHR